MKYLGIDYGTKKIGIAMTDDDGMMAFPRGVVAMAEGRRHLLSVIQSENINAIVIGLSLDHSGKENIVVKEIKKFGEFLKKETNLPIHFMNEGYTSIHSRIGKNKSDFIDRKIKKENEGIVDDKSAVLILERFLANKK